MTPGIFDLLEVADELILAEFFDVLLQRLAITDDGAEWCAELVAHIGEELRFVLARNYELLALAPNFGEQRSKNQCAERHKQNAGLGRQDPLCDWKTGVTKIANTKSCRPNY